MSAVCTAMYVKRHNTTQQAPSTFLFRVCGVCVGMKELVMDRLPFLAEGNTSTRWARRGQRANVSRLHSVLGITLNACCCKGFYMSSSNLYSYNARRWLLRQPQLELRPVLMGSQIKVMLNINT
jgi:hypothetical protein